MKQLSFTRPPPGHHLEIVDILRSTLMKLEQSPNVSPDDPALAHVRRSIARTIAELELLQSRRKNPERLEAS